MNERIEKLSDEAYLFAQSQHSIYSPELLRTYTKQFAELIVRDCAETIESQDVDPSFKNRMSWAIKTKFGVE